MRTRFLAQAPRNKELFLLLEGFEKFSIFKGNKSKGLHLCESMYPMMLPPHSIGFVFGDKKFLYMIIHSEIGNSQKIELLHETLIKEELKIVSFDFSE